jgi:AbrB family looped-hinge helix DNA binding protein
VAQVKKQRRRGFTRLSSKHQVTIPARALELAGVGEGDELKVDVDRAGRIILSPAAEGSDRLAAIEQTAGALTGVYRPGTLEKLRNEWR